jgi:hypothetical protein
VPARRDSHTLPDSRSTRLELGWSSLTRAELDERELTWMKPDAGSACEVVFRFVQPEAAKVFLAGSFNGWTPVPMFRRGEEWLCRLQMAEGTHD